MLVSERSRDATCDTGGRMGPRPHDQGTATGTLAPVRPTTGARSTDYRVGWGFVTLYGLSFTGNALVFIAPLLVTLALKVNDLVGIHDAPKNLALVTGTGSLLSMIANPLFGRLSDRTTARMGMRRPWMLV